jgi:tetratricopeptide (TPR) repeat protein
MKNNFKNYLSIFAIFSLAIFSSGCSKNASDIDLSNVEEHRLYIDTHEEKAVILEYEKLLSDNPNSEYALYYLAKCIDSDTEQIELLSKALEITPDFYYANYLMGATLFAQDEDEKSYIFFEKCIKIDPTKYYAHLGLGRYYLNKGSNEDDPELKLTLLNKANQSLEKFKELGGLSDLTTKGGIQDTYNDYLNEIKEEISKAKSAINSFFGRYKNSKYVYEIRRNGTYAFYILELNTNGMSQNEMLLTDYDELPRTEVFKGNGKWTKNGNNIKFEGPGLSSEYFYKNGSLCEFNIYKNDEVCFDKQ